MNIITMKATMTRMPTMTIKIVKKIAIMTKITTIKIQTMMTKMKDDGNDD
jgi:hypothetical protein